MKAEDILAQSLCESVESYLRQYPELTIRGLNALGYYKKEVIAEECAILAETQKQYCGCSMTRKSTCDDIAHNIRTKYAIKNR